MRSVLLCLPAALIFPACDGVQNFDTPAPPVSAGDPSLAIDFEAGMEWTYAWTDEQYAVPVGGTAADSLLSREAFDLTARVASVDAEIEGVSGLIRIDVSGDGRCRVDWYRVEEGYLRHVAATANTERGYVPPVITTYRSMAVEGYVCGAEPQRAYLFSQARPIYPMPAYRGIEWEWTLWEHEADTLAAELSVESFGSFTGAAGTFFTADIARRYSSEEEETGVSQRMEAHDYISTDGLVLREDVWTGAPAWEGARARAVRRLEMLSVRRP